MSPWSGRRPERATAFYRGEREMGRDAGESERVWRRRELATVQGLESKIIPFLSLFWHILLEIGCEK